MSVLSRFLKWRSKDPMQRTLYIIVPTAHIALFCFFAAAKPPVKSLTQSKLVVKTFSAPTVTPNVKTASTKQSSAPAKPAAAPKPAPKPEKKTEKKPETTQPKKPAPIKKEKSFQVKKDKSLKQEALKELEERIAKIEAKNDRMPVKSELAVPSAIALSTPTTLPAPQDLKAYASSFSDEDFASSLVGYLQGYLQLPDVGEVQIHLTLRKDGKVESMKVMRSESAKNKKYLEEHLPKLSFPAVYLEGSSSRSFLFTFCNKF